MQSNFNSVKVMAVVVLASFSFFTANAQTKKGISTLKSSQNISPAPTKNTASTPISRSSSSSNLVPQSSFIKGSKYLGGGASYAGSALAINLSAEYGVTNDISVGGVVWYSTSSSSLSLGLSADYHLGRMLKLGNIDPYVGVSPYYTNDKINKVDNDGNTTVQNGMLRVVGNVGVNYYINAKTKFFAQYSIGVINGGYSYPSAGIKFSL